MKIMKSSQELGLQLLHMICVGTIFLTQRMPDSCVTRAMQPVVHPTE